MDRPKITKYPKRIIFPPGKQYQFLKKAKDILNVNWQQLAKEIKIRPRTFNDWKRELFSISLPAAKKISEISGLNIPKDIEVKNPFWYTSKGSQKGGEACLKKYGRIGGDPEYRKNLSKT